MKINPASENSNPVRRPIYRITISKVLRIFRLPKSGLVCGINEIPLKQPQRLGWFRLRNLKIHEVVYYALCTLAGGTASRPCYRVPFSRYTSYLSKVSDFNPPHLHLAPPYGLTPGRISRRCLASENYSPGLFCGTVNVILRLAVLVEHRLVTDRQTDTGPQHIPHWHRVAR